MTETDPRLIVLADNDTVAVARCAVPAGETLVVAGQRVVLSRALSMGHKVAIRAMSPGDRVLKYGASIGSATDNIAVGDHVHLHNMKSEYTPTYALPEDTEA